jgi:hypothetical protein
MRVRRQARRFGWIALAAILCVSAAWAEESFVHTDDGCAVEIHCLACRLAVGTTAVIGAAATVPAVVQTIAPVGAEAGSKPREAAPREAPSRAPPLA